MTKNQQKTIGLVLVDKFADWEFGLLSAGAVENLGAKVVFLSPEGLPVRSIGGLEARPSRGLTPEENSDIDAVALAEFGDAAHAFGKFIKARLDVMREQNGLRVRVYRAAFAGEQLQPQTILQQFDLLADGLRGDA